MKISVRGLAAAVLCGLLSACGGGSGGETSTGNASPAPAALISGDVRTEGGYLRATVGGIVRLDAGASVDADGDPLTFAWLVISKPEGSTVASSGSGRVFAWTPDVLGRYTFALTATDDSGASSTQRVTVIADNRAPSATVVVTPRFTPVPVHAPLQGVTVLSNVVLDATGATDPGGARVTISFEMLSRPEGSTASLQIGSKTARFSPDTMGTYKVRVTGVDARNASFVSIHTFRADNRAPNPIVVVGASPVALDAGETLLTTSVGYDVLLDGSSTSDPDGGTLGYAWELTTRPAGSTASLTSPRGQAASLSPDVLGDYRITLTVRDSKGASSTYVTVVRANNRRPLASVTTNATPGSHASGPTTMVPLGTQVTFRGDTSVDADGDVIVYAWTLEGQPAGSTAALSSASASAPTFTADVEGIYVFRLRVTDTAGAFSESTVSLLVGTHAPVAMVDKSQMTTLPGDAVQASAALSYDQDGDTLTYLWSIDAMPTGSAAVLSNETSTAATLVPDLPGVYALAVRVSDGTSASLAYVTVRVLPQFQAAALGFVPGKAFYSKGLDKLVIGSANPDSLRVVDPFTGASASIALLTTMKNFSISPNGKLAAVLYEGLVSLVDLETLSIVRSTATLGAHTDALVTDAGIIYAIGQTGGQGVPERVVIVNGRTGARTAEQNVPGRFYGTQYGVLAGSLNKVFHMSLGLSPADIDYFTFNPTTTNVTGGGDSPYHGHYQMSVPLYLSSDEQLVFTSAGTYFNSGTLAYVNRLGGVTSMVGFSHSAGQDEAWALNGNTSNLPSSSLRFTGPFLLPAGSTMLPTIDGAQSYGLGIFHSAAGSHVGLVQTGSSQVNGAGAQYFVIAR